MSAFAGRKDLMEMMLYNGVAFGGTFNGNPLAMAGAYATLNLLERGALWEASKIGAMLMNGIRDIADRHQIPVLLTGFPTAFSIHFTRRPDLREYRDLFDDDADVLRRFVVSMINEGVNVLPDGRFYTSAVHTENDIDETLSAVDKAMFQATM